MEPSVEPLSATITSPRKPAERNAAVALSIQKASELASFRQGMTTETSGAGPACATRESILPSESEDWGLVPMFVSVVKLAFRAPLGFTDGAACPQKSVDCPFRSI